MRAFLLFVPRLSSQHLLSVFRVQWLKGTLIQLSASTCYDVVCELCACKVQVASCQGKCLISPSLMQKSCKQASKMTDPDHEHNFSLRTVASRICLCMSVYIFTTNGGYIQTLGYIHVQVHLLLIKKVSTLCSGRVLYAEEHTSCLL